MDPALAYRLYHWATFLQGCLPLARSLPLIWTSLSCHLRGTGLLGPSPTDKHTFSANPKPQLQRSWRYILSSACFLAPIQTHNEWSRSPQPGATPSTLFTLLPFTHSSCSSPNDAGPSYQWSKADRELFSLWLHFKPDHFLPFEIECHCFERLCFNLIFSRACFLFCQMRISIYFCRLVCLFPLCVGFIFNVCFPTQRHLQPIRPPYSDLTGSQQ